MRTNHVVRATALTVGIVALATPIMIPAIAGWTERLDILGLYAQAIAGFAIAALGTAVLLKYARDAAKRARAESNDPSGGVLDG
jgi:hypothetical protein